MTSISKIVYVDKLDDIMIKKVKKSTVLWTYVISICCYFKGEGIVGTFYEEELEKTNQKEFRVQKVIKRKSDKPYVKSNGYNSSFNGWIDKKDIV